MQCITVQCSAVQFSGLISQEKPQTGQGPKACVALTIIGADVLGTEGIQAESQKSIDFCGAAFLSQNIASKVRKSQHFVLFGKIA